MFKEDSGPICSQLAHVDGSWPLPETKERPAQEEIKIALGANSTSSGLNGLRGARSSGFVSTGGTRPCAPDYEGWRIKGVNSVGGNLSALLAGCPHLSVRSLTLALCSRILAQSFLVRHGETSAP